MKTMHETSARRAPGRRAASRLRGLARTVGVLLALTAPAAGEEAGRGRAGVDAFLVLDNSGSMRTHDPGRATGALVVGLAEAMSPGSRLGVVLFDETARVVQPLSADVGPGTGARWADVAARLDYTGQRSNGPAGVERALYALRHDTAEERARAIVVVTDGIVDTGDPATDAEKTRWLKEELVTAAHRAGVRIFGVAFSETADVELVQALALGTGGDYWRMENADRVDAVVARTRDALRARPEGDPGAGTLAATGADAGPRPPAPRVATPPVSAAGGDADRTRGLVLLGIGLAVAVGVAGLPLVDRLRRRPRVPASAFVDPFGRGAPGGMALPALPRAGRPPIVKLVDVSGATASGERILLLDKPTSRIGRDPASEVAIPDDTVSSFHATIDYRDGYFHLEDQRSTNGTTLNGHALEPHRPVRLKSGDAIRVAAHALRFVVPDHEPRGRTAVLSSTALPAGSPAAARDPRPDPEAGAVDALVAAFDGCLAAHLARVEGLGERHRRFVDRAFPPDVRALLARRSQALIERCRAEGQAQQTDVARGAVCYTLCVVPDTPAGARTWFVERFGGYAKLLVGLLDARAGGAGACEAICVITFGTLGDPWISLTVVPAHDDADAVELMSMELLSADERREAADLDLVDVGRDLGPA